MLLPRQLKIKLEGYAIRLGQIPWKTRREWLVIASNEVMDQMISLLLVKKRRFFLKSDDV